MAAASSVTRTRRSSAKTVVLVSAVLIAAVLLALLGPTIQKARLTHACTKLGGQLSQSTEDVEPLVSGRTVYRCYGPDGQVLEEW